MNPLDLSARIRHEIGTDWEVSNAHGVDLRKCLVDPPVKKVFVDSLDNSDVELWLVLEENVEEKSGYKIVFDPRSDMFGLATASWEGSDLYLGSYGSFLDTLQNM